MEDNKDARREVQRLQRALEALASDLDAIEQRPHFSLRITVAPEEEGNSRTIECFVDRFAFALRKGSTST